MDPGFGESLEDVILVLVLQDVDVVEGDADDDIVADVLELIDGFLDLMALE